MHGWTLASNSPLGRVEKVRQRRSLPLPERLARLRAEARIDAQACRQVAPLSCSRTHLYVPRAKRTAAFPSAWLRAGLDGPH
jgi:hypothetical protein